MTTVVQRLAPAGRNLFVDFHLRKIRRNKFRPTIKAWRALRRRRNFESRALERARGKDPHLRSSPILGEGKTGRGSGKLEGCWTHRLYSRCYTSCLVAVAGKSMARPFAKSFRSPE